MDVAFDGVIRVRRYLCRSCKRTVSLLPEFALPYLRFSISVISLFLIARLLNGYTLVAAAQAAAQTGMPYQRGQFWIRRFQKQAARSVRGAGGVGRAHAAPDFVSRALQMLAIHRLDRRSPLPVFRSCAPTCWAGPRFSLRTGVAPRSGRAVPST